MRRLSRERSLSLRRWPWLPLPLAVIWALLLVLTFRSLVNAIFLNADIVSALTIGELLRDAPDSADVALGNFPWYTALWFEALTRDLPFHRHIWEVGPYALSLIGVALVAWSVWRAVGPWAGAMVAILLGCAGPPLLQLQFSFSLHAATWFCVALLGTFLVACAAGRGGLGGRRRQILACMALALVTAGCLASDPLLLPAGVIPFVLAGVAMPRLLGRRVGGPIAASAIAIGGLAAVGAPLITAAMERAGMRAVEFDIKLASFDRLGPNFRIFMESLTRLFNGDFGGQAPSLTAALALACAAVVTVALVGVARFLREWAGGVLAAAPARFGAAAAGTALVTFWALAGLVLTGAFLLTSVPLDRTSGRYLVGAAYALAVLTAVAASSASGWRRAAAVAGVCLVTLGSSAGLLRRDLQDNPSRWPDAYEAGQLNELAQQERLGHGYAGYWDAAALTWQNKGSPKVYPVWQCPNAPPQVCPFYLHRISSWYGPRPRTRTFLVIDPEQQNYGPSDPGDRFGKPDRIVALQGLTVYVYGYDIASRFSR